MIEPKFVNSRIQYDLAEAIGKADGKLHIDDALIIAGTPCALVDYAKLPDSDLKYISRAMRRFFKRNPRYSRFQKSAISEGLRREWLPNLEEEEKRIMLVDFKMTRGVDDNGFLLYDEEWVNRLNARPNPDRETYGTERYTSLNGKSAAKRIRNITDDAKYYHSTDENGYDGVTLDITEDEWYQIIKEASEVVKEYLGCYIQVPGIYTSCTEIEDMFDVPTDTINPRNSALGSRAQRMLGIEVYQDETEQVRRLWSTPMLKGRPEDGLFRWKMRPELIAAATRLAKEEKWDLPSRKDL